MVASGTPMEGIEEAVPLQATPQEPDAAIAQQQTDLEEDVPPPPMPIHPRGERRARVAEPPPVEDDGPTYTRIGIDHTYEPEDEEIHFQCCRIKKLENLETAGMNLRKLIIIAGCIEKIENLESNKNLVHLELYQNLVKKIENITHLTNLTVLDLSFNKIRSAEPLGSCPFEQLERLYLSSNKIVEIQGVFHFKKLKMLELGCNRLRGVPPIIAELSNLEELWLGKNKIVSMALPVLPKLKHLSLQNNRLEVWESAFFNNLRGLTHLYMGHNNLPDLPEEFALLTDLQEFDLAKNAVTTIRPIPQLTKLKELWLNDNQITDIAEVRNLASFSGLMTVYLERNPFHGLGDAESEERYKDAILQAVPGLMQLDAVSLKTQIKVITDGSERTVIGIRKA